jgi:hypothetical protein
MVPMPVSMSDSNGAGRTRTEALKHETGHHHGGPSVANAASGVVVVAHDSEDEEAAERAENAFIVLVCPSCSTNPLYSCSSAF